MTNTETQIPTPTFDLKPGDTIRIHGTDYEVFDAFLYTGNVRAVQIVLPSGSTRTIKGDEFVRVVGSAIR